MMLAFCGDAAIKASLLARLDSHIAAESFVLRGPVWEDGRGTVLGVSIEDSDPAMYAQRYGYPLSLAAALDAMTLCFDDRAERERFIREWVQRVSPGAQLANVPRALIIKVLSQTAFAAAVEEWRNAVLALHEQQARGEGVEDRQWSALRSEIEDAGADEAAEPESQTALALLATACWPARRGRSLLTGLIWAAQHHAGAGFAEGWNAALEARAFAHLAAISDECAPRAARGEEIDYPAMLRMRAPEIAAGFEDNLTWKNERYLARGREIAWWCVDLMGVAPVA